MMTLKDMMTMPSRREMYERLSNYEQELLTRTTCRLEFRTMGEKTTVCLLTLKNSFEVVGTSACVNPKQFNYDEGCFWALKQALNKVDEYDGYLRHCSNAYVIERDNDVRRP